MLTIQRHLLKTLKAKGPVEAAAYTNYLIGLSDRVGEASTSTTQLALPSLTDEDDPEAFLRLFERAALSAHLPKPQWGSTLASLLAGDAKLTCDDVRGGADGPPSFQALKGALLGRAPVAEENCRVRFRSQQHRVPGLSPRAAAWELQQEAIGWLKPHSRSGWEVMQCVVMEQLTSLLPEVTADWIRARRPSNLEEAVKLAETHLSLSADPCKAKGSSETPHITSETARASPEGNCPSLPQRMPSEVVSPTKPQENSLKSDAESSALKRQPEVQLLKAKETSEVQTEAWNTQGTTQLDVQSPSAVDKDLGTTPVTRHHRHFPLSSSTPVAEEPHDKQSCHSFESETMDTGDEYQLSQSDSSCNTTLDQWGQQRPERGPGGEEGYICGKCGKSFVFFEQLHRHQRSHSDQLPFLCGECGHSCRTSAALKKHRAAHAATRLLPCPDCGESFTYAERLVHHRTVHAALRPHRCPVCQKSFRLKKVLKKHEQIHQESERRSAGQHKPANLGNKPSGLGDNHPHSCSC
ncbi:hypothetical protein MATL_G00117660 [Megalops atlanticus]|uniref:Uncharacterized protein n=1 Tax=Megalops atlanticus TaxID=7932 RepID=A0A9D3PZK1_MEGAT|nr:hypothetical protein MATL_G00117660 [Megalops atlanticus]